MNIIKTGILLAAMTALFMAVGFMIGGEAGMILALIVAGAMNFIGYWNSDKIVLSLHGARQIDPSSAPKLFSMVEQLSHAADLPTPKIYIIDNPQPNAFATGRNPQNAAVAATTGLLDLLSDDEVAGVMAHELAHIGNRDTLIMTIAATFAGAISMLANFGIFFGAGRNNNNVMGIAGMILLMILAPLAAMLVQMAISRSREYAADRKGAEICGNPSSLANALVKISAHAKGIVNNTAENHPATAHMFIINPLTGRNMANLFSTHPNTESRVEALNELALQRGAVVRQSETSAAQLTRGPSETPWSRAGTRYINKPAPGPWDRSPRQ